MSLFADLVPIY